MANDEADINDFLSDEPKKKESFLPFLVALIVISLISVGAGWFLSSQLPTGNGDKTAEADTKKETKDPVAKGDKPVASELASKYVDSGPSTIIKLEPIIVSLAGGAGTFVRMELALVFEEGSGLSGEEARLRIGSELASFVQTLSLQQISGPSGYLHLREDLLDRARLSTAGEARDLLVLSMVSE